LEILFGNVASNEAIMQQFYNECQKPNENVTTYGCRLESLLETISNAKFFSKLDLCSGFWQLEMKEADNQYTAFTVGPLGFYECNQMPFGLTNAPAAFQKLMQSTMGDLNF
jgi:hypothetical protein